MSHVFGTCAKVFGTTVIEGLRRQWAVEFGPHAIRVVTLKTGGVPESIADSFPDKDTITASIEQET